MNHADPSARPRVALFSTDFLAYSQTFVYDELCHHERYDVDVFSKLRLNADRFPYPRLHTLGDDGTLRGRLERRLYATTTLSPTFSREIRRGGYQLLHAHFGPGSLYALPIQKRADLPLVVTYHGYDVPLLMTPRRFRPSSWRYWLRSKAMLRRVSRFLAASDELARLLVELGAPPERVKVWRLGVHIPALAAPPEGRDGRRVLMVGRFVEKKGFAYAIDAFADAVDGGADAILEIVGDGPLRAEYDAIVARRGVGERVRFLGVLGHDAVLEKMLTADVLMCPSVIAANGDRESGILVAKEAGARYVPVIGTHHGGIPEIIDDGVTGFLVPERDARALGRRLAELLGDPALRASMGAAAREKMVREYDIVDRVRVLEQHYDEVIAAHRARTTA